MPLSSNKQSWFAFRNKPHFTPLADIVYQWNLNTQYKINWLTGIFCSILFFAVHHTIIDLIIKIQHSANPHSTCLLLYEDKHRLNWWGLWVGATLVFAFSLITTLIVATPQPSALALSECYTIKSIWFSARARRKHGAGVIVLKFGQSWLVIKILSSDEYTVI